jgi:hypothetical protein
MPTLQDIETELVALMDDLTNDERELTDEQRIDFERRVRLLVGSQAEKVDGIGRVLRGYADREKACIGESERLIRRAEVFHNKRKRLLDYVLHVMEQSGTKKMEGNETTLTRIQNPETVDVVDPHALPFEMQRWTFTFKPTTKEDYDKLDALLWAMEGARAECAAAKRELLDIVKRDEHATLPAGASLMSGTWRLAVR